MLLGTGAAITPARISLHPGETFFPAGKALKPVDDAMRVGVDLGKLTEDRKKAVLSGVLKLSNIGNVKVELCRSQTACIPMIYSGTYFSRDSYGIGFYAVGPQLKQSSFIGVKVTTAKPLDNVAISWSNYSQ